ncbi:MAG: type II secretion system protein GspG [Longimicrobiales bacterium]
MIKKLFLLCIVLIGVAMAVPSTRAQIQDRAIQPVMDEIGNRLVPRRLDAMADQLDVRLSRAERLPADNFAAWVRRDYTGPEVDPWGNPWFLQVGRRDYTVGSLGADGQLGTGDDLTVRRSLQQTPR